MEFVHYALIGILAGFFAGLLGIGGGVIIGPLLIVIFSTRLGFDAAASTHIAIATSMAIIAVTTPISAITHARRNNVSGLFVRRFSIASIIGAALATLIATAIRPEILKIALAIFLLYNSKNMLLPRPALPPAAGSDRENENSPKKTFLLPVATGIGCLSSLLGVGGGILNVPYMVRQGLSLKKAIGCSACVNVVIAWTATAGYLLNAPPDTGTGHATWGMIYPPALLGIALFSMLFSYVGARTSTALPTRVLRPIFGFLTLAIAFHLLWSLW